MRTQYMEHAFVRALLELFVLRSLLDELKDLSKTPIIFKS